MNSTVHYPWIKSLGPHLTEEQAQAIYKQGREAVIFALLSFAKKLAEQAQMAPEIAPSTPSGMVPPYKKPSIRKKGKPLGRPLGHQGVRRQAPTKIDQYQEHRLQRCPHCQSELGEPVVSRSRTVEDIPENIRPIVTQHTIWRYRCNTCHKIVEPTVPDALPKSTIGNHLLALTAWLHYGLGNTLSQIVSVLNYHLHSTLSDGGLVQMWQRLAEILYAWYEQIGQQARKSAVLHSDETGWRVSGVTHWLWCFSNSVSTYYMIDRCRGSPALKRFFTEAFEGTLITDFWGAYNKIVSATRQICLVHLLRALAVVDEVCHSTEWEMFRNKLRRLLRDAVRLSLREECPPEEFASKRSRLDARLAELIQTPWEEPHAKRLTKRLRRHCHHLFTFLDLPGVPSDNNHAEREIRPAVIIRKNSLCNRSEKGANTQAILMSVYRTLKLRGHDPIQTIASALAEYLKTGSLPPLPVPQSSHG